MRSYLPEGYVITTKQNKTYTIVKLFGEGASCVAYYALDEQTKAKCVLKELYPAYISIVRNDSGVLSCTENEKPKFEKAKKRFIESIDKQISLRNRDSSMNQIFYVGDRFEENGTLYVVVPQYSGGTYSDNSEINLYDRMKICKSVINYVSQCHSAGYLCLDIKPDNIFILPETSELAMFFDFDSLCRIDEVLTGRDLSYTSNWAAPEQVMPSSFSQISKATDIYVLGELIYWSIFDRHSSDNEHRRASTFSFSESRFIDDLTPDAEDILTEIFHHTLRSSSNNRYKQISDLMERVDDLLMEIYPGKESIINVYPQTTPQFVGREDELLKIEKKLGESHLAVLTGVGGIGKSEIAKKYVCDHKDEYKTVIYWTYSFDLVSTINRSEFLTDFEQKDEESELHYCNRKISKLYELFSGKNLIVIDNLNVEIEEIAFWDIWKRVCELPCDLIITTRCKQDSYFGNQIYIDGMGSESLKVIFHNHCPYELDQEAYVDAIIESVQYHTLVVELIAKQAHSCLRSPFEMLTILEKNGILGLNSEHVKWDYKKKTVADHVKGLFSMFAISEEQKKLLFIMAFMPVSGIDEKIFYEFFKLNSHNDLRYLIDNGWIYEQLDSKRIIAVHPVITSVVMDAIKNDSNYAEILYKNAIDTMDSWSVKDDINQEEFFRICNSLALQTCEYKINNHSAADYIIRYNSNFAQYGNKDERRKLILFAIDVYNQIYPTDTYAAVRENAYENYIASINDVEHYEEVKQNCKSHLRLAKKSKDLYMESKWYLMLYNASHIRNNMSNGFSLMYLIYYYKIFYIVLKLEKENKKRKTKILSDEYLEKLHYGYMKAWKNNLHNFVYLSLASCCEKLSEENVFFTKNSRSELVGYSQALGIRNRYKSAQTLNGTSNSVNKHIDEAKLAILSRDYAVADDILNRMITYFEEHHLPTNINIYIVHDMIATIALTLEDYEKAIKHYNACLEIAKTLNYHKNYGIRNGLARAYLYNGDIDMSKELNYQLYIDLKEVDKDNRGTAFAEMYYNTACRYYVIKNREQAEKFFLHSISQFNSCSICGNRRDVGIARCQYQLGELFGEERAEKTAELYANAYETFKRCLGDEHVETQRCLEKLNMYRSYLKK